ncbi:MAG TPA: 2OG-Fe(II) oxygenase family protein [Pseudomonadales bacterium]|nr:2OG-Fe(II) oxygenase family protein [Pseudomonadales bacterium]
MSRAPLTLVELPHGPAAAWDPAARARVLAAVDGSLRASGFMALHAPDLAADATAPVFAAARAFFAQPVEAKARVAYRDTRENFGWQGLGVEALDPSRPGDLKESFTMRDLARHAAQEALFPSARFRSLALDLHARCDDLARTLMGLFAELLEVPFAFLDQAHSGANVTLRVLSYPGAGPDRPQAAPEQLGAGAHTDYGSFTLLMTDGEPGLQIRREGRWEDVDAPPGTVVVNTGDLMAHWSNDRYRSTWHRVVPPARPRLSIAFFVDPDDDTKVCCLPSCTRDREAAYADTTAGAHILRRLDASRG